MRGSPHGDVRYPLDPFDGGDGVYDPVGFVLAAVDQPSCFCRRVARKYNQAPCPRNALSTGGAQLESIQLR
jgi:hypothetical protein